MSAPDLVGRRVLIAYGLLGDVAARLRPLGMDYMDAQADWLRQQGARVAVVPCPTPAPVAENAARIRATLLSEPEPALLLGHSKGGLESLAALTDPGARARCSALIALASPFAGSPVADWIVARRPLRVLTSTLAGLLGGSGEGIRDLTTTARTAWRSDHAAEVAAILAALPVVCVGARLDLSTAGRATPLRLVARWLERAGAGPNDGLVTLDSALLPGARHLIIAGDHLAPVSLGRGDPLGTLARAAALALGPG